MSTLFNKKILLQDADIIRYEDKEAHNTAERVGRMFVDIINAIDLSLGGTSSLTLTEVGNYLTNNHYLIKSAADGLYQPKGNYLTQHQSLSNYYTKPEIDTKITALNTAINTKLDKSVFDDMFEKVQVGGQWVIRAKYGFYSNQFISALGLVQGDLGGGTGTGGGSLFGLMRSWPSVDPGPSTQEALGANLGWELRGRIAALETAGFATQNWVLNKNYLTAHQDISHLLRIDGSNGTAAGTAALLNKLGAGDDNINDNMTFITSLSTPGANTAFFRRPMSYLWNYIKGKADAVYQPKGNYALASALGNYYTKTEVNTKLTDGSVTKVGTATVGASNWPIYLNNGVPYACAWKFGNYNGAAAVNNGTLNENLNADMLDGLHVGNGINRVARFTNFPTYADFGYEGTANETYFSYLLKKLATDNSGEIMAVGRAHPNSQGVFIMHGYTGRKNGYPQYGSGLYVGIDGRVVPIRVQDGIYTYGNGIFDGNAASASRLQTTGTYTAWGQTYFANGVPQSVSGNMTGVGKIGFSNDREIGFNSSRFCFGTNNQGAAVGVNVGSLLVSNAWADYTKVPVNGIYIKGALRIGDILIEEDKANGGLKISGGVYATKYVSALGLATGNLSGGSSGGGTAYDRLDAWADYTTDKAGYVLSAGLGADLNSRVGANATSINSILSRLNSLEGGGTTSVTVTGSGNAITDISKGGTAIIATKGATFLTQHQALDHINTLDLRTTAVLTDSYKYQFRALFMLNSTDSLVDGGNFHNVLHISRWGDNSGGKSSQLAFTDNGNMWLRVGTVGSAWEAWQKILTSANYASVLGSVYQAKGDYVKVAGSQTVTGAKTFTGGLLLPYSAGTWISMAKRADQILGAVPTTGASAHSLFTLLNSTGAAISYGGLGVNIGFYGFYKSRMDSGENSYDWATTWNLDTGRLNHTGELVARSFIKNGGTSSQFLMADGSTVSKVSASDVSHTGWGGIATDDLRIPTMTFLALWNGAYNSNGASNLQYCYQGRFGDIVTQSLSGLDSRYVKKSGDTMTGILDIVTNGASLKLGAKNNAWMHIYSTLPIAFNCNLTNAGKQDSTLGIPDYRWANVYATTINVTSTALVANLNADLLDGLHSTAFSRADQSPAVDLNTINGFGIMCNPANANATAERHYPIQEAGTLFYGTGAYGSANQIYSGYYSNRWFARGGGSGVNNKTSWREFAFTDSNVASATKLQTARSIYGVSFDGTDNVNGAFHWRGTDATLRIYEGVDPTAHASYGAETLCLQSCFDLQDPLTSGYVTNYASRCILALQPRGGRVSIGSLSAAYTLDVTGTGRFTGELQVPTVYASNWFRSTGNSGWYSQTHGGGIYMTDANWVRVYNNKGLRVQEGVALGTNGFIVGLKLHGASHEALEVSAGNYTMGFGCHSNGSWYWWRGTANPDSAGSKSYVMQYNGSVWNFTGQLRCDSLRIGDAIFSYDAAHNGIKLDKGLYSEGYLSALGLSELTNTKFTISAGYESDALTILNGGITRSGYSGDAWNKGYGALNVAIDTSAGDSKQTPLLLAFSAGATDLNVNTSRLFALELLNNGDTLDFKLAGEVKLSINKIGLSAWSATLNYINATSIGTATVTATGKITCQSLTQTSDMRLKNVVRPMDLSVEAIAKAPSFIHRWKRDGAFDLGSSAQYWKEMSPLFTPRDKDGFLTMQYGKAALLSAIAIARRTVSHEERIRILESENKKLRAELNDLKARLRA